MVRVFVLIVIIIISSSSIERKRRVSDFERDTKYQTRFCRKRKRDRNDSQKNARSLARVSFPSFLSFFFVALRFPEGRRRHEKHQYRDTKTSSSSSFENDNTYETLYKTTTTTTTTMILPREVATPARRCVRPWTTTTMIFLLLGRTSDRSLSSKRRCP